MIILKNVPKISYPSGMLVFNNVRADKALAVIEALKDVVITDWNSVNNMIVPGQYNDPGRIATVTFNPDRILYKVW